MSKDPYRYFRVEAKDILEQLSRCVLDWEREGADKERVGQMLRLAHTLKGAAHVVKQAGIAHLAHQLEDALRPGPGDLVPAAGIEVMLRLVDGMAAELAALGSPPPATPRAGVDSQPTQDVAGSAFAPAAPDELFDTVRIDVGEMDALLEGVAETGASLLGLKTRLAAIEQASDLSTLLMNQWPSLTSENGKGRAAVSLGKARSIAGELQTLLRSMSRNLDSCVEQVERELAQVRDAASQLRLIPASAVFATLRRTARNTAQSLGKQAEFETMGGEHRLDAPVLTAVRDALLQLVRNAVTHGIEAPAQRTAAGKPTTGRIRLRVQRRGNRVSFACEDDGAGFDVTALRRAAIAGGLVSPAEAESLGIEDVFALLLRGGISTAAAITELAGRGIGLDLVRETAAKLKAKVSLKNSPGHGSTVEILVPVSLLSLAALRVESDGVIASLPLDAVEKTLRFSEDDVVRTPDGESIALDGRTVPFLPLARVLGQQSPPRSAKKRFSSAVLIRSGSQHAVIGISGLLGTAAVFLRPIPGFAGVDPVIAGAALDAEGSPQLVLDPAVLVVAARASRAAEVKADPRRTPVVLVIDDSLTTRMLEQSILESAGYEVHLATSAEEALEKARASRYDLFVVDVEMPGMDGFEFVARTRSDPTLSEVPSILVTSRNSEQDKRRGEQAGARAYFVKSEFSQEHLLSTIRRLAG